jgi:predicted HTH domain antitoxin
VEDGKTWLLNEVDKRRIEKEVTLFHIHIELFQAGKIVIGKGAKLESKIRAKVRGTDITRQ